VRVRVRRELLPLLRSLDPRIVDHVTRLADSLAQAHGHTPGGAIEDALEGVGEDQDIVTNDE
jgi:hypothetical protein